MIQAQGLQQNPPTDGGRPDPSPLGTAMRRNHRFPAPFKLCDQASSPSSDYRKANKRIKKNYNSWKRPPNLLIQAGDGTPPWLLRWGIFQFLRQVNGDDAEFHEWSSPSGGVNDGAGSTTMNVFIRSFSFIFHSSNAVLAHKDFSTR